LRLNPAAGKDVFIKAARSLGGITYDYKYTKYKNFVKVYLYEINKFSYNKKQQYILNTQPS
jgi:hypothetical protein